MHSFISVSHELLPKLRKLTLLKMLKYARLLDAKQSSLPDMCTATGPEGAWNIWCQEERMNRLVNIVHNVTSKPTHQEKQKVDTRMGHFRPRIEPLLRPFTRPRHQRDLHSPPCERAPLDSNYSRNMDSHLFGPTKEPHLVSRPSKQRNHTLNLIHPIHKRRTLPPRLTSLPFRTPPPAPPAPISNLPPLQKLLPLLPHKQSPPPPTLPLPARRNPLPHHSMARPLPTHSSPPN